MTENDKIARKQSALDAVVIDSAREVVRLHLIDVSVREALDELAAASLERDAFMDWRKSEGESDPGRPVPHHGSGPDNL